MSLKAFLQITPKEFYLALKSKGKYDGGLVEDSIKWICESIRTSTWYSFNLQVVEKDRKSSPKKLMSFPWDEETYKKQTVNQMKNVAKMIAKTSGKKSKNKKE